MKSKANKSTLESPMQAWPMPNLTAAEGTYDHNPSPVFSQPRSMGGNARPERFTEGNHGATVPPQGPSMNVSGRK